MLTTNSPKRHQFEMVMDILEFISNCESVKVCKTTHIIYGANVNQKVAKEMLIGLTKANLISLIEFKYSKTKSSKIRKSYMITYKGKKFIEDWNKLEEILKIVFEQRKN